MKNKFTFNKKWFVGFTDGEGCFTAYLGKKKDARFGYQIQPAFIIPQHSQDIDILNGLKNYFNCGHVNKNKGKNDPSKVFQWRVRKNFDLCNIIIPFFEKNKLQTTKQLDFLKFRKIC